MAAIAEAPAATQIGVKPASKSSVGANARTHFISVAAFLFFAVCMFRNSPTNNGHTLNTQNAIATTMARICQNGMRAITSRRAQWLTNRWGNIGSGFLSWLSIHSGILFTRTATETSLSPKKYSTASAATTVSSHDGIVHHVRKRNERKK